MSNHSLEIITAPSLVTYPDALFAMEQRVASMKDGTAPEQIWLLEHPPLYTAGTSAHPNDLVDPDRFPVYDAGRGGQYTYHGPGQRVGYFMLDLRARGKDVRLFIYTLEQVIIDTLSHFGIKGERRADRVGVWVVRDDGREEKIAAIGVRVRGWITFHGIAINLNPNLEHFAGIVPCGIAEHGVTSFADMGLTTRMSELDTALINAFDRRFGRNTAPMPRIMQESRADSLPNGTDPIRDQHPVFQV